MAIAIPGVGGFEYDFVTTPPDWLICNICYYPSREPYLSDCCGNTFCKSCLEGVKKATTISDACPVCRNKEFITFRNKQADRLVRSLHVFCTNKEKGCEWQGEVNDIINHLGNSDGCKFEEVTCSNDCGKCLQRQYLTGHVEDECVCRKVDCQYCHITGEYQFIEGEHKEQCPKFPIACPNKCEVGSVPRDDVEEHMKICPLELIQCEYHVVGCEERMARMDKKNHNKGKMEEHLFLSVSKVTEINQNFTKAKMEKDKLSQKLTKMERDLDYTKQQLAITCQDLTEAKKEHITLADNIDEALARLETKFQTKITEIETAAQKRITELETKLEQKIQYEQMTSVLWYETLCTKTSKLSSGDQVVPVIVKMSEYTKKKRDGVQWYSDSFYTHHKGYKMCLKVYAAGYSSNFLSVGIILMRGAYDGQLRWPLKGHCEVKLLNLNGNNEHHLGFGDYMDSGHNRVTIGERSGFGYMWRSYKFISNENLHEITTTCQYFRDDSIFLQVDYTLD